MLPHGKWLKKAESDMEPLEDSNLKPEEVKRKLGKTILDNFSKLVNPHDHVRSKSAASLLKYLAENSQTEEGLNELKYALKRLVRGLGSQTFSARAGYYSTLVALLNFQPHISAEEVLELVKSELHKSGKNSDAENADICVGQILACGAIIHTNRWPQTSQECQKELLEFLLAAGKERIYLKLFGYSFLIALLKLAPDISGQPDFLTLINDEVSKAWAEQTMDSLYLLLNLRLIFPKVYNRKFVKAFLGSPDIVCEESLDRICEILMTLPRATALKHPIYDLLITIMPSDLFAGFFNQLDKHLKTPNRNRLLAFIKILTNTFSFVSKRNEQFEQIPLLVTKNFITQLLGYFRTFTGNNKDKDYQEAVQKLFSTLVDLFRDGSVNYSVKVGVIKKLLFDPGTFVFEKVTKSKVVQQITLTMDIEGVKMLGSIYQGVVQGTEKINSENNSETWLNNDRLYSAHLLIKLLSLPAMKQENDWKVEVLKFLMGVALIKNDVGTNVGRELADSLKTAFFGALDLKLSKLDELQSILLQLVQFLDSQIDMQSLSTILRTPLTDEAYQLWQKTMQTVKKIEKKHKKSRLTSVFLTLFLHMALQLFSDPKLATESLNELFSCYERVKKDKKAKKVLNETLAENSIVESEDDPYWLEVVIDLFLNLLSHNSHLLRSIINSVFPHLCQFMNSSTIHQVVSVLDPRSDENPLSKNEDSDSESEEDEESDEDEEGDKSNDEDNNEEDSEDEGDNEDETVNNKLRMALHQALSNGATQSDDESIDLDQMSDSEGEKLDKALADAFRQFKPNHGRKKKQSKDQETLTHFRVRVLDLVEIYLDSNPSMLLALEVMLPLLQAVEFSIRDEHQKPLHFRLKAILKKLLNLKKFSDIDGVDDGVLIDLLKSLLDKNGKNALIVQEMGEQIADCCIFVVKCSDILRNVEGISSKVKKRIKAAILEVISGELYQFCVRRDSLTPYVLFKSLLQSSWEGNIGLAVILLDFMFSAEVRQYKKNQVLELLKIFYSNQRFFSLFKSKAESKMIDTHREFSLKVVTFFNGLCEEPDRKDVKERFICNFFNLLTALKHCPLDQSAISWADIAESVREYRSYKTFSKDAKVAFNKLCRALGVSNIVKMKPKTTELAPLIATEDSALGVTSGETVQKDKKKQKRKTHETLKLKKEAKKLRLESLSKGLGKVNFDNEVPLEAVPSDDSQGEIEENEVESSKKRKKRRLSVANGVDPLLGGTFKEMNGSDRLESDIEGVANGDTSELLSKKKKRKK